MVFVIPGGVLGIRCNLEGSSFEPRGHFISTWQSLLLSCVVCSCLLLTLLRTWTHVHFVPKEVLLCCFY